MILSHLTWFSCKVDVANSSAANRELGASHVIVKPVWERLPPGYELKNYNPHGYALGLAPEASLCGAGCGIEMPFLPIRLPLTMRGAVNIEIELEVVEAPKANIVDGKGNRRPLVELVDYPLAPPIGEDGRLEDFPSQSNQPTPGPVTDNSQSQDPPANTWSVDENLRKVGFCGGGQKRCTSQGHAWESACRNDTVSCAGVNYPNGCSAAFKTLVADRGAQSTAEKFAYYACACRGDSSYCKSAEREWNELQKN